MEEVCKDMPYECVVTNNLRHVMLDFSSSCLSRAVRVAEHLSLSKWHEWQRYANFHVTASIHLCQLFIKVVLKYIKNNFVPSQSLVLIIKPCSHTLSSGSSHNWLFISSFLRQFEVVTHFFFSVKKILSGCKGVSICLWTIRFSWALWSVWTAPA